MSAGINCDVIHSQVEEGRLNLSFLTWRRGMVPDKTQYLRVEKCAENFDGF
jgi:hypothetical protein